MGNVERELAQAILTTNGLSTSKLGLRFDRVVVAVMSNLRSFAATVGPTDVTVLVAITAPIILPAKTMEDLQQHIGEMLSGPRPAGDRTATLRGNDTRLRLVTVAPVKAPKLIGFVHNRGSTPEALFDLAEQWLHSSSAT